MEVLPVSPLTVVGFTVVLVVLFRRTLSGWLFRWLQSGAHEKSNPYLIGGFAPVKSEVHEPTSLPVVEGSIPMELDGWYIRTGPNPQFDPIGSYHWFDGEAMLHSVVLSGGEAKSYCSHWIKCNKLLVERAVGHNLFMRFGDMRGVRGLVLMILNKYLPTAPRLPKLESSSMGNTALVHHARRLLALHEGSLPYEVQLLCNGLLESAGSFTLGGQLRDAFTAHPKIDPATGELAYFGYTVEEKPYCTMSTISAEGKKSEGVPVDFDHPVMQHDFAISKNYAVFFDHNLVFKPEAMGKGGLPLVTDKSKAGRIGLVPRAGKERKVTWYDVGKYVMFHTANAWEEGKTVHVVVCRFEELDLADIEAPEGFPQLTRYSIDTATGMTKRTTLCPGQGLDFPVVNPLLVARQTRFCWCTIFSKGKGVGLLKADMHAEEGKGQVARVMYPEGTFGGEAVFVPRDAAADAAAAEDDGYLVGYVTDEGTMESFCTVYDARDMTQLAKIKLPARVPYGFHGLFVPQSDIRFKASGDGK